MSLKSYILQNNFNKDGLLEIGQSKFESANLDRYARVAQQSYQSQPQGFDKFTLDSELSTPEIVVFQSPNETALGLRGTQSISDSVTDIFVTLGDYSENGKLGKRVLDVQNQINKIKNKNIHGKKISVSGHSLGGSIANQIAVDNPDVDVFTFNRGSGINPIPSIKNSIYNNLFGDSKIRSNIKNFRISGDIASFTTKFNPFANDGTNVSISPLKATPEMKKTSDSITSTIKKVTDFEPLGISKSLYSEDYYLAHSLDNFIGRSKENIHPDPHVYSRKLAQTGSKIGTLAATGLYSKYKKNINENIDARTLSADNRIDNFATQVGSVETAKETLKNAKAEFKRVSEMTPAMNDLNPNSPSVYDLFQSAEKAVTKAKKKLTSAKAKVSMNRQKFEGAVENLDDARSYLATPQFIDAGLEQFNSFNPLVKALFGGTIAESSSGVIYDMFSEAPDNEFLI